MGLFFPCDLIIDLLPVLGQRDGGVFPQVVAVLVVEESLYAIELHHAAAQRQVSVAG